MCVLVFVESWNGKLKKSSFEAISYGRTLSKNLNLKTVAIAFSNSNNNFDILGKYGVNEIMDCSAINLKNLDNNALATIISRISKKKQAKHIIISNTNKGKSICSKIAFDVDASLITNAISIPENFHPLTEHVECFRRLDLPAP